MKNIMQTFHWLFRPENSLEETSNGSLEHMIPWWLPNLVKVTFWYGLALTFGFLLSELH